MTLNEFYEYYGYFKVIKIFITEGHNSTEHVSLFLSCFFSLSYQILTHISRPVFGLLYFSLNSQFSIHNILTEVLSSLWRNPAGEAKPLILSVLL